MVVIAPSDPAEKDKLLSPSAYRRAARDDRPLMRYLPHTPEEIAEMPASSERDRSTALFEQIPAEARLMRPLAIEPPLDEPSLMRHLDELSHSNR